MKKFINIHSGQVINNNVIIIINSCSNCCNNLSRLKHFYFQKMKAAGLNLFPACDSAKFVNIQNKVRTNYSKIDKLFLHDMATINLSVSVKMASR